MYLTPQERAVQGALEAFWYEYYTKELTTDQRNELAGEFAEKWLDGRKFKIDKAFIRHPATKTRQYDRNYTVADILADFIIRADQVEERSAEYPVGNPDYEVSGTRQRQDKERSLYFKDDLDKPKEERDPLPPYSVRSNDIKLPNSIEDVIFAETAPDIEQFRKELRRVKKYAEYYATSFAQEYGYDKTDALRRIKRLDLSRVRECEICGSAFYAHDLRRHVCDMQRGISDKKPSDQSACELERDRQASQKRYLVEKMSIY
jgi:hypothetical protein